ncbi:MAG: helix-turn-helix domain-containing protein [Thauera sp.]|nr:helix-turn-helix domain-containing protein [Thauera sp.]
MSLADDIDELREENRQLKALLAEITAAPDVDAIAPRAGASERVVLAALYRAKGRTVPYEALADATRRLGLRDDVAGPDLVRVHVHRLRKKLVAPWRVTTVWATGYRLECGPASSSPS